MEVLIFPPGTALLFTSGEYSDFTTRGVFITLRGCDLPSLAQAYRAEKNPKGEPYCDDVESFPSWLVAHGWVFPADVSEVHLGGYGDFDAPLQHRPNAGGGVNG